jgi:protein-S-isoprenylcysteine O-methyltransferase Ste14
LVGIVGYLLPLLASFPPIFGWAGLMTLPLVLFLIAMAGRIPELPLSLPYLFLGGSLVDILLMLGGFLLLLYSVLYLWRKKPSGLVSGGPYRVVRHPQYLGLILLTAAMTSRSIWVLSHTFGMGWLSLQNTLYLWYAMLLAYVVLALIEELHLAKTYAASWQDYRGRVGFLLPLVKHHRRTVEIITPLMLLSGMMYLLAYYNTWLI